MFTGLPLNAFVPVFTFSSVPVPTALVVEMSTPIAPSVTPAPAVRRLPLAIVVSPLSETGPVPVVKVVPPLCVKLSVVLIVFAVVAPLPEIENTVEAFSCSWMKLPVKPLAAFA